MPEPQVEQEVSDEQILEELDKYVQHGVIDYVIPTDPIGEAWVIGYKLTILKFNSKYEVVSFLSGVTVTLNWAAARLGLHP
ncbi:MAG TPA: hypothetical protein VF597_02410 [Candidatus Saccharimonadales bacterium]|jgi:hypothetical protein